MGEIDCKPHSTSEWDEQHREKYSWGRGIENTRQGFAALCGVTRKGLAGKAVTSRDLKEGKEYARQVLGSECSNTREWQMKRFSDGSVPEVGKE